MVQGIRFKVKGINYGVGFIFYLEPYTLYLVPFLGRFDHGKDLTLIKSFQINSPRPAGSHT